MSFPYMNSEIANAHFFSLRESSASSIAYLPAGQYNMFQSPGVLDASAMEFSLTSGQDGDTDPVLTIASGASTILLSMADGGASGDATTIAPLFAATGADVGLWSNSIDGGYAINEPITAQGTTATDLDADDWVNLSVLANATGLAGSLYIRANYIYNKPGAIA